MKRDGCLQSLPICLSEMPDSPVLRQLSENIQRDVDSRKHMIRLTNWREKEQETFAGKLVFTKSRREDFPPLGEIWVGKFTD